MTEIIEKRTLHSKTHDLGNGQHRLVASMIPMHYEENGTLHDIDMTIQNGVVNSGLYKVELLTNKIGFKAIDRATGKTITVSLGKVGNHSIPYEAPTVEGNRASWSGVRPGVDIEFIFNNHQVNIFRVLNDSSAEKVCEWDVDEETGDKVIKMNTKVRGRDASKKETKHTVLITPPEQVPNRTKYTIRDTFDAKVYARNPQTRVKTEVEPTYPVRIDPTVTITISDTADDGYAYAFLSGSIATFSTLQNASSVDRVLDISSGGFRRRREAFFRFPGITIPMSSTINSATLKPYITGKLGGDLPGKIRAKKLNNPSNPSVVADVFSPGTLATNEVNKTFTTAASNYANIDVQPIVQELVNAFDYSSEAMLFLIKRQSVAASGSQEIGFEDFTNGASNHAQLVIDYTAGGGGSSIKTWNGLADASTKTVNGVNRASVKNRNGLA